MPEPGLNYRLSDILCAVGLPQVRAPRRAARRAQRDRGRLRGAARRDLPSDCPTADEGDVHGWQAYVIQVDRRDEVLAALRAEEIEAQIGTSP